MSSYHKQVGENACFYRTGVTSVNVNHSLVMYKDSGYMKLLKVNCAIKYKQYTFHNNLYIMNYCVSEPLGSYSMRSKFTRDLHNNDDAHVEKEHKYRLMLHNQLRMQIEDVSIFVQKYLETFKWKLLACIEEGRLFASVEGVKDLCVFKKFERCIEKSLRLEQKSELILKYSYRFVGGDKEKERMLELLGKEEFTVTTNQMTKIMQNCIYLLDILPKQTRGLQRLNSRLLEIIEEKKRAAHIKRRLSQEEQTKMEDEKFTEMVSKIRQEALNMYIAEKEFKQEMLKSQPSLRNYEESRKRNNIDTQDLSFVLLLTSQVQILCDKANLLLCD